MKEIIKKFTARNNQEAEKLAENHRRNYADEVEYKYNPKTDQYEGKAIYRPI